MLALTGRLYAVYGNRAEALKTIAQLKSIARERYVADYSIALIYAALGEKDQAFELLEKVIRIIPWTCSRFTMIRSSTTSDPIRALRICSGALG